MPSLSSATFRLPTNAMAEKDIQYLNSLPDDDGEGQTSSVPVGSSQTSDKKVRALWSPDEETVLITAVLDREEVLFGDFQGTGFKSGQERKRQGWEEVAGILNAQFSNWKRSAEVCRKKYNNAKQRAKEKIDLLKKERRKTGGGQVNVTMTEAEEVLLERQDGRPGLFGLEAGFDSDACTETQNTVSKEVEIHKTNQGNKSKECSKGAKKDRGCKRSLTEENLAEDTKRIKLHQRKLELEIIKLEKEIEMLDAKTTYYKTMTKNEL